MSQYPPTSYYSPPPLPQSQGLTQLKIAAIITMVAASLAWLWSLLDTLGRVAMLAGMAPMPHPPQFSPQGALVGFYIFLVIDILTIFLAPLLIFATIQMLRRKMYGFCRVMSIVGMLPIAAHCCCIVTLPMGIWMMITLNRPDVKDAFTPPQAPDAGPPDMSQIP